MASCDDDFSLLGDDANHSQHHLYATAAAAPAPNHRYASNRAPIADKAVGAGEDRDRDRARDEDDDEDEAAAEEYGDAAVAAAAAFCSTAFDNDGGDRSEKRKESRDDLAEAPYSYKKPKQASAAPASGSAGGGGGGGEYRKDREEWSDAAIACLLDAYTEKFTQLNRGNLRGRDWEEVAAIVSERCERQSKSVEQCKNKVDNLKKRYKLERQRMNNGGISASHWPWFKKMEQIVGNSQPMKVASDEDKGAGSSANTPRQSKRYAMTTASSGGQLNNMKPKSTSNPKWRRVIFKISGGALAGSAPNNLDPKVVMLIAREVAMASRVGVEVAIVVGGRNFFCGNTWVNATGLERSTAYQIGMMATVMNSVLLQSAIEKLGVQTRVQTAFSMQDIAEPYSRQRAIRHLEKGRVVIFAGIGAGAGNPLFSTDSAAALRALEIHAEAVLKGTNVDGVYDCTSQDSNFTFEHISFRDLAARGAILMDSMALTFCEENRIPVVVFNLLEPGNISKALCGEQVGTLIDVNGRIS